MYNFSPDFEVEGPDKNWNYSIRPRTFKDSNDNSGVWTQMQSFLKVQT